VVKTTPRQHLITTLTDRFAGAAIADRNTCERWFIVFMSTVAPMPPTNPASRAFSISA
jgi:hypothetical protein